MADDVNLNLNKPFEGLERVPGDLITALDWNNIQIATKNFLWNNVGVIKEKSTLALGNEDASGNLYLFLKGSTSAEGHKKATICLDGSAAEVHIGSPSSGLSGNLLIHAEKETYPRTIQAAIRLYGEQANMHLGGKECGSGGDIYLHSTSPADSPSYENASIHLGGEKGQLRLGGSSSGTNGLLSVLSANSANPCISLNGANGDIYLGGNGTNHEGAIFLFPNSNTSAVYQQSSISLSANGGKLRLGGRPAENDQLSNNTQAAGTSSNILLYSQTGTHDTALNASVVISGEFGDLILGGKNTKIDPVNPGKGNGGTLCLFSESTDTFQTVSKRVAIDQIEAVKDRSSQHAAIYLEGSSGSIYAGGKQTNESGHIYLYSVKDENCELKPLEDAVPSPPQKWKRTPNQESIHLDGLNAKLQLGGPSTSGVLELFRKPAADSLSGLDAKKPSIKLEGETGDITVAGNITIAGDNSVEGTIRGTIEVPNYVYTQIPPIGRPIIPTRERPPIITPITPGATTLVQDGYKELRVIDNVLQVPCIKGGTENQADIAEEFDFISELLLDPGSVMVITQACKLTECTKAYDKRVAGVFSGAGHLQPSLVLNRQPSSVNRVPLALIGVVCCKADASEAAIEVGDLLTTSSNPGHAMKAADPSRAFGAVLGKALEPLAQDETGLIAILVTLQ